MRNGARAPRLAQLLAALDFNGYHDGDAAGGGEATPQGYQSS